MSTGLGDLAQYLPPIDPKLPKKERTRSQLLEAGVHVLAARGIEATTIQEIAERARVTPATFYNHFPSKEAALVAIAGWVSAGYGERVNASMAAIDDGAHRMSIGNRRFVQLAVDSPRWAMLFLQLGAADPELFAAVSGFALADLRVGIKQRRFKVPVEEAGLDLISGTIRAAMVTAATGRAPRAYDVAVSTVVLRGLGMSGEDAAAVARRTLPALPPRR